MTTQLEEHRKSLRAIYVDSTPKQRLKVALDRLDFPDHEPNLLITRVSAVEAMARSLLVHHVSAGGEPIDKVYKRYKNEKPEALLDAYLSMTVSQTANQFFGEECWDQFQHAVQYRHLLVHECTYLAPEKAIPLLEVCRDVLRRLVRLAGLPEDRI